MYNGKLAMNIEKFTRQVKRSVRLSIPLGFRINHFDHQSEDNIEKVLELFLKELDQSDLMGPLSYCVKELAVNANKANTKRVYFQEKNLNLQNPDDYQIGMVNFKSETLESLEYWLDLQKKRGLFIRFIFHPERENFRICVINNSEITRSEQMRIYDRIARSRTFSSLDEAFSEVMDDSEGAGLGIVIVILMLKKIGLDENAYEIEGEAGLTTVNLKIPINRIKIEKTYTLINQIVDKIDSLPMFPENITQIQEMLKKTDCDIAQLTGKIITDASLTAEILKTVNSALYARREKIDSIIAGVKMLGFKGIQNILLSYGTEKILQVPSHPVLWEHSRRVAFYSFNLARHITRNKDIIDNTYLGGILHDIGKIIFSDIKPSLLESIKKFSQEKSIDSSLLEEIVAGYNHAETGARIAKKWHFPDSLIEIIRCHHEPLACLPEYRVAVYCVYLGNCMNNYENGLITYDLIDRTILSHFRIRSEEHMKSILQKLNEGYETELAKF